MRVITYDDINREEWGRLVRESTTGTWFQTPEAYAFFASMQDLFEPFVIGAYSRPLPKGKGEQPTSDSSLKGRENFASVWGIHTADSTQYDLLNANACANRKNPTEAELVLWDLLKSNNIGLHFRRQHVILDYIVDFICIEKGLIIELDGEYHNDPEQKERDENRTAHLQQLGYSVLRFTNEDLLVNPDEVIATIKATAHILPSIKGRIENRLLLRGVCVGYVTKERSKIKQYFTRRAIILGGPALADDATSAEVEMLMNGVRKHLKVEAPIYIETRNFNDYSPWREAFEKAGFAYQKHLNFHVRPADFELRLSDNRKRQWHKIEAQNAHLEVREAKDAEELSAWYSILSELYRRKVKTPLLPEKFFMNAYTSRAAQFLVVVYDGKVIGGSMLAMDERCVYEWYECGLNSSYKEQYPSVAATCAGIRYAQEQGCTRYDMMGAGEPGVPYGVRDFKSEFGGEMVEHGRYLCICKPGLYKLGTLGVRILKRSK